MNEYQREELIKDVEKTHGRRSRLLDELKISRTTYYRWRKAYDESGLDGITKSVVNPYTWTDRLE